MRGLNVISAPFVLRLCQNFHMDMKLEDYVHTPRLWKYLLSEYKRSTNHVKAAHVVLLNASEWERSMAVYTEIYKVIWMITAILGLFSQVLFLFILHCNVHSWCPTIADCLFAVELVLTFAWSNDMPKIWMPGWMWYNPKWVILIKTDVHM